MTIFLLYVFLVYSSFLCTLAIGLDYREADHEGVGGSQQRDDGAHQGQATKEDFPATISSSRAPDPKTIFKKFPPQVLGLAGSISNYTNHFNPGSITNFNADQWEARDYRRRPRRPGQPS